MDEQTSLMDSGEMPSRMEWRIEQEKLKLERELIALERERLEAMRERVKIEQGGRGTMRLSSAVLCSIICLLVGGILGSFSMSMQHSRNRSARLQEVMQSLGSVIETVEENEVVAHPTPSPQVEGGEAPDEGTAVAVAAPPPPAARKQTLQIKTVRPKGGTEGSGSGISLIVIQ